MRRCKKQWTCPTRRKTQNQVPKFTHGNQFIHLYGNKVNIIFTVNQFVRYFCFQVPISYYEQIYLFAISLPAVNPDLNVHIYSITKCWFPFGIVKNWYVIHITIIFRTLRLRNYCIQHRSKSTQTNDKIYFNFFRFPPPIRCIMFNRVALECVCERLEMIWIYIIQWLDFPKMMFIAYTIWFFLLMTLNSSVFYSHTVVLKFFFFYIII